MKDELVVDLLSQKTLLNTINLSLKQNNQKLQIENNVLQKLVTKQSSGNHIPYKAVTIVILAVIPLIIFSPNLVDTFFHTKNTNPNYKGNYVIENLRGDTVDTWLHWNLVDNERLTVNIVNANEISQDKLAAITDVILSEETVVIDDSSLHKGPKDSVSTYYMGWSGALKDASKVQTSFYIPKEFAILESQRGEGEITINLMTESNTDGYTGYTKSITDNNQIVKSTITIYDIDSLSAEQIATITRHEFGHALGLAHSTAPEDLMAPQITTLYPYISQCDIDAISALYDGKKSSQVICEK